MSNREYLKAVAKGLKPVYVIFYYVQDGEICIFSGCKGYPEEEQEKNLIIPCFGDDETRPDDEVIRAFEARANGSCKEIRQERRGKTVNKRF